MISPRATRIFFDVGRIDLRAHGVLELNTGREYIGTYDVREVICV